LKEKLDADIKGFEESLLRLAKQQLMVEGALQYAKVLRTSLGDSADRSADDGN
jgi:hypothetical protein